MIKKEEIKQQIFNAIDEINENSDSEDELSKSMDTILFGGNSKLDSLGLINLIIAVEQNIEDEFNISITLADEKAMSQDESPFESVASLSNYIELLLNENSDD